VTNALPPATARAYRANVWKLYAYTFVTYFQLWWPIWVIFLQDERDLSLTQIGALESVFWVGAVVLLVPAGAMADRWGRRLSLLLGSLVTAVAVFLFAVLPFPYLIFSWLLWSLAIAMQMGKDAAFLYDTLKALGREEEYPLLYGRVWALTNVAALLATLAGAPIAAAASIQFPILVSGGILLLGAVVAFTMTEPKISETQERPRYWSLITQSTRLAANLPTVRYMILLYGVIGVASVAPIVFFQPFLTDHDVPLGQVGFYQVPVRILAIAGALAAYRAVSLWGEHRTIFLLPVLSVASYAVLGLWDSIGAAAIFPILALTVSMARPVVTAHVNRRVPSEQRATVLSLGELIYSLVLASFVPAMGAVSDQASLGAAFGMAGLFMGLTGGLLMVLWTRAARAEARLDEAVQV
jgi:MFS family permease